MAVTMKASMKMDYHMEKASLFIQMENLTSENTLKVNGIEKEYLSIKTESDMKVSGITTK